MAEDNPSVTWNKMTSFVKQVAKCVHSKLKDDAPWYKDTSWSNEEIKNVIKVKGNSFRDLKNTIRVSSKRYKLVKKVMKTVQNTRSKSTRKCARNWALKTLKRIYAELFE